MDLPQRILNEINIDINLDFIKNFENCKNLKKFSFISYQSYTTAINWRLPETDDSVVNYLKEKEALFPNLKELKLNFKATENSQHFLQYLIKKNVNLDKLTISYLSYKNSFKLIERIDKINDLKILHNSYENFDQTLQKRSQPIEVNKLIIQALLNPNHFLQLVDNLKLKEINFIYGTIDYKSYTNYDLENLNELQTIYLYKSKILIPVLKYLIKKSENNLQKLTLLKSELTSGDYNIPKNQKDFKELQNLRYLKMESCKNDYSLFYSFLLQYNLPKLEKLYVNDCYNIEGTLLEHSLTKINLSNLIGFEILGSPFDDELMLKMLQSLQNKDKIKLNLSGKITEQGLISISKEVRKKIVQLKLPTSSINLIEKENEMTEFINDLNDKLSELCLNFREFGPTVKILKVISNKFKELRLLNIKGKMTIDKIDLFDLVNQLDKTETISFDCPVNNCTDKELEEFKKKSGLMKGRLAPNIFIPIMKNSNIKQASNVTSVVNSNCLLM
ncbi:hypothetical protein ABK040_007576 [Willaertia magna]